MPWCALCVGGGIAAILERESQFGFDINARRIAVLDDLNCTGSESNLFDCPHPGATVENCFPPFTDANVICGISGTYT